MKFRIQVDTIEHPWDMVNRLKGTVADPPMTVMLEYHNKLLAVESALDCHLCATDEPLHAPYVMNGQVAQRKGHTCIISCGGLLVQLDGVDDCPTFQLQRTFKVGLTPV